MANEFVARNGIIAKANSSITGTLDVSGNITMGTALVATRSWVTSTALTGYATENYVTTAINNLIDAAPGTLNTLNELAAALGDDPNFATTISNTIATKLPLAGGNMTGNINWTSTDKGLVWAMNSDGASIKFYNTADGDTNSRLEFNTLDNNNEYFRWTHSPSGGTLYESMKLVPNSSGNSVLTVQGSIYAGANKVATESWVTSQNYLTSYTNTYVTGAAFNTSTGVLTLTRNDAGTVTVDLDGKYAEAAHTHSAADITSGTLASARLSGNYAINITGSAATLTTARNIALTGAVTGNANFDGSGNISIATTATSDPVLTINGDGSGSATFTNLGNATLTLTVNDDSHNHIISNIDGLQTALDGKQPVGSYAVTSHKYHSFGSNEEYYDSYSQSNYLRLFTENAVHDNFRFASYNNVEYWNGSAWVTWGQSLSDLFDGIETSGISLTHTYQKFRFEISRTSGWPTTALFVIDTTWTDIGNTSCTVTLETYNGTSWVQKDNWTYSSFQRGSNLRVTNNVHDGYNLMRVTLDMNWTDNSHNYLPLRRIMLLSNFSGNAYDLRPWTWNYNKDVTFASQVYVSGGNSTNWNTAYSWGNHAGLYDNYGSWNLKTNGVQRTTVQSGGTLDIVAGTNVSVSYGAGGVVTINSTDTNTNNYLTGLSFNTSTGVLTATRQGLSDITVDLDGKYAEASHTHPYLPLTGGTLAATETHTTGAISYTDAILTLYNNWQSNTDEKGSILAFTDNYYDGTNYVQTTRAAIKGGTDTTGNTADGFLAFYTDSAGGNSANERMRIDKSGNVGIGTSSPARKFEIHENTTYLTIGEKAGYTPASYGPILETNSGTMVLPGHVYFNNSNSYIVKSGTSTRLHGDGGISLSYYNGSTTVTGVTLNTSGNVGIGTTTPAEKLTVAGTIQAVGGTSNSKYVNVYVNDSWAYYTTNVANTYMNAELRVDTGLIGSYDEDLQLRTAGTTRIYASTSGNVGIGTTAPGAKLHVNGSFRADGTAYSYASTNASYYNSGGNATFHQFESYWNTDAASSIATLRFDVGTWRLWSAGIGDSVVTVKSNGYVNIGANTPLAKLSVGAGTTNTGSDIAMFSTSSTGIAYALSLVNETGGANGRGVRLSFHNQNNWSATGAIDTIQTNGVESALVFSTYSTGLSEKMRITHDGNVAINSTTTSGYRLYVNGSTWINGGTNFQDGVSIFRTQSGAAEVMRIASNGNVGIGTTSPSRKLEVQGDFYVNGTNGALTTENSQSNLYLLNLTRTTTSLTTAGNAGIGTVSSFGRLQIAGASTNPDLSTVTAANVSLVVSNSDVGYGTMFATYGSGVGALQQRRTNTNTYYDFALQPHGGRIGIGTLSPSYTLDVNGNARFSSTVSSTGFVGSLSGNATTASALATARTITLSGAVTGSASFDGSANITISTTATPDPTLTINGDASGSATFTNLGNATLTLTIADDSHNHVISNVDGLQTALNGKAGVSGTSNPQELAFFNSQTDITSQPELMWTGTDLMIIGGLQATTKSFNIEHPTKPGKRLVYGVLEGPEHGVYTRGRTAERTIMLPEEWTGLVDQDSITVQLTAVGKPTTIYVVDIKDNKVFVDADAENIEYFYYVQGTRKDIEKLEIEQ